MRLFLNLFSLIIALSLAVNQLQAQDSVFLKPLDKTKRFIQVTNTTYSGNLFSMSKDSVVTASVPNRLPLNFYSTHLGAACKMELQLEKQTKLPIRIRLGSKEQVDYLEGKFSRNQ